MARISKDQLIKLQKKYKTDTAIGELYGISRQAVHQLRTKYGIAPVEDKTSDRDKEVIRLYTSGVPGTRIARKMKLSPSQTYRILRAQGLIRK